MLSRILIRLATVWAVFVVIVATAVLWNSKHGGDLWWGVAVWALGPRAGLGTRMGVRA